MKMFLTAMTLCVSTAFAQTAEVRGIEAEGDTTISISKGKNSTNEFQITDGTADISGDPEILSKEARNSWKKACDEWKKEIKDLNKENQVLALTCNSPTCTKNSATETLCRSSGAYKVKTKVK